MERLIDKRVRSRRQPVGLLGLALLLLIVLSVALASQLRAGHSFADQAGAIGGQEAPLDEAPIVLAPSKTPSDEPSDAPQLEDPYSAFPPCDSIVSVPAEADHGPAPMDAPVAECVHKPWKSEVKGPPKFPVVEPASPTKQP
jgi:hypothetical protein